MFLPRTPTSTSSWSLPALHVVLKACANGHTQHGRQYQAVLQMALMECALADNPPRAAGLVERVANGSEKAAAEITALLDAHHQLTKPAPPPPPLDANGWAQTYEPPPPAPALPAWAQPQHNRAATPTAKPPAPAKPAAARQQPSLVDPFRDRVKPAPPQPKPERKPRPKPDPTVPAHSPHLPARQSLEPCPRGTERHRIVHWVTAGLIDPAALGYPTSGIASAVAAAYRRLFGDRLPPSDPGNRSFKVYSRREITLIAANIRPRQ